VTRGSRAFSTHGVCPGGAILVRPVRDPCSHVGLRTDFNVARGDLTCHQIVRQSHALPESHWV